MIMQATVDRKEFIGGSDIAAVMGMSRWKTPLQLWAEKTGQIEQADLSSNEAVQLGTELEDFVAKKFERETGLSVRRSPKIYIHDNYLFMRCQVDRLVTGTDELLECKTCSAWKEKEWDGEEIPQEYILQVMWQLMITGRSVGHIAVLIGGQKFRYKKIEADKELFKSMTEAAVSFWKMVEEGTPPMANANDNDFLVQLYPNSNEEIQLVEELNNSIKHLQELKMHRDNMEEEIDTVEAKIKEVIKDSLGIRTSQYIVKWTPQAQCRVDTEALRAAGLYEKYSKKNNIRVMRITKAKETPTCLQSKN